MARAGLHGGGRKKSNQFVPTLNPPPIFPTPLRIRGSSGAITRATLEATSRYNIITSNTAACVLRQFTTILAQNWILNHLAHDRLLIASEKLARNQHSMQHYKKSLYFFTLFENFFDWDPKFFAEQ